MSSFLGISFLQNIVSQTASFLPIPDYDPKSLKFIFLI